MANLNSKLFSGAEEKKNVPNWPSRTAQVLKSAVTVEGKEIYHNVDRVKDVLLAQSIPAIEVVQLELALRGSSIVKYLDSLETAGITAVDINNILRSVESSGLATDISRTIIAAILYSLNVPQTQLDILLTDGILEKKVTTSVSLYIPPYAYEKRLKEFQEKIEDGDAPLGSDEISELKDYVNAGVAKAFYLLGCIYLKGLGVEKDEQIGRDYVYRAISKGYRPAYALWGDSEYENNDFDSAYISYRSMGAVALDPERAQKMRRIMRGKAFAKKVIVYLGIIYAALSVLMLAVLRESPVNGVHAVAPWIFFAINTLLYGGMIFVHIKRPFKDLRHYSIFFAVLFCIFMFVILL
ncbi:MAG: sel1 repeat family protein [Clostridia bacterium]|nr:sel1 repeat family protein [Clostridia bacterium]